MRSLFCALLSICLLVQAGWAQDDCAKAHPQQIKYVRREFEKFADRVNLTDQQRQRLRAIKQTTDQQIESLSKTVVDKQRGLIQSIFGSGATQSVAEQQTQEILQLRNQIALLKLRALLQARDVMTQEQRYQFALLHQQLVTSLVSKYPTCLQPLSNGTLD